MRPAKINYPYVITHLLAAVFLTVGVRQFAFLCGYDIMQNLSEYGIHEVVRTTPANELMSLFEWLLIATFFGFHLSAILSFIIMLRKRISMINPLIVFLGSSALLVVQFCNFESVLNTRDSVGHFFRGDLLVLKYAIPGAVFIVTGLVTFFNPWTNKQPARPMLQYS